MIDQERPVTLLGASTWYPLSARLAMAFIRHGAPLSAICPRNHPLRLVPGIRSFHPYKGIGSLGALKSAIVSVNPYVVVPCDDGVVLQLYALHEREPSLRPLVERSLGQPESYAILSNRDRLLRVASELGIRIPLTQAIDSEAELANWPESTAVVKADGSTGGEGTVIAHSRREMLTAYLRLREPLTAGTAAKRLFINRSPLAVWRWRSAKEPRVILQQFIPGRPANTMIACWRGEVLASVTVEVLSSQGATGAATVVRLMRHDEIEETSRKLARRLMLNGFHGLDFILENKNMDRGGDAAHLIELNPRCTQLGHLHVHGQGDLAAIFNARLCNGAQPPLDVRTQTLIEGDVVAFFPQALLWNPHSPYLHQGHHDVPWEAPELVRELLLEEWPYRQAAARFYHYFHPPFRPQQELDETALEVTVPEKCIDSFPRLT
jgi:hypothetical protein